MWEPELGDLNDWANQPECPDDWHRNDVLDQPCPECGQELDPAWVWYDPPASTPEETR